MESQTPSNSNAASNIVAPTLSLEAGGERYAYRRLAAAPGFRSSAFSTSPERSTIGILTSPTLLHGHGRSSYSTMLAFGRSSGVVPDTVTGMAKHALAFLDGLGIAICDVLGYSLGGMVAQQMALDRSSISGA
jgi:pimeloyl-ACP methyl ester carboxylesterase